MNKKADSNYGHHHKFLSDCQFFDVVKRASAFAPDAFNSLEFQRFSAWMDAQLAELEQRFQNFTTARSNRGYFSR